MCTGHGSRPVMSPANTGMPMFSTPGFQPLAGVSKPELQAAHGNRFGVVPSTAGPLLPQVNGVPASGVPGAAQNARSSPLVTNASPFLQQYNQPPPSSSSNTGLQNAVSAPVPVGLPPAGVYPAQVSFIH